MSVRPKKSLGQHFLADPDAVRAIVDAVQAPPEAGVVEIGPGEGALTGALVRRYPGMVALEVDRESIAHLEGRFPALDVRQQDVLEADWRTLRVEASEAEAPLYVVGNLPYYITSPILFALLDAREHVARAVVMIQKEVAERLVAEPGSKTYGTLSVYFALFADREWVIDVGREAFRPPPKVESAVVALTFAREGSVKDPGVAFNSLQRVVRAAFGQRRKMMRNSLKPLASETGREVPEWAARLRPEQVSPDDFVRLTAHFFPDSPRD